MNKKQFNADKRESLARLSAAFHNDLVNHWATHGSSAIEQLYASDKAAYVKLVAGAVKTIQMEVSNVDADLVGVRTREELRAFILERGGEKAIDAFNSLMGIVEDRSNVIDLKPNPPSDETED